MANYIASDTDFISVADAIRAKGGTSASLSFPGGFVDAIEAFPEATVSDKENEVIARTISGEYVNSRLTTIGAYAFQGCYHLTSANFPICTTIGTNAFNSCSSLTTPNFPVCTLISMNAFGGCSNLTTVSFSACTTIGVSAFKGCSNLTTVSFPACTMIYSYAFQNCSSLPTVSFPACTTIGDSAFQNCDNLISANFPMCTVINANAFNGCSSLTTLKFPACTRIGISAFSRCYHLLSLYLLGSSVASLINVNAFISTPISTYRTYTGGVYGSIYVRASLLTEWQAAKNWTVYSSRFVGLTDEEIAALEE